MEEEFKVIDNYLMVRMPAEVDHHASEYIGRTADRYILKEGVGNVVFDFEKTRFMDSSGIGIIIGRYKKITCWRQGFCGQCGCKDQKDTDALRIA